MTNEPMLTSHHCITIEHALQSPVFGSVTVPAALLLEHPFAFASP